MTTDPSWPPGHGRLLNPLLLLVIVSAFSQVVYLSAQFTLLLYVLHLQVSPTTAGLVVSIGALSPALIAVRIGRLIDRKGGRTPMLVSLAAQIIGAVLPFASSELPVLLVATALNGTSFIVFRVASQQAIGRTGRIEDRAANYSLLGLGYSLSTICAPLMSGFAIEHYGFAPTFLGAAILVLLPLAVIGLNFLRIPGPVADAGAAGHRGSAFALLAEPDLRRIFIATVLINGAWDVFMFLIPLYGTQLHMTASQIGTLTGVFASGTLFVRAITAQVLRFFAPWQVLIIALALSGSCFIVSPAFDSMPPLLVISFFAGMGMGIALPVTMALAFDAAPAQRAGEMIGLRLGLSMASAATLPLLCGALGAAFGIAVAYWVEGAALLAGAWINRRQWRHRPRTT